jgi:hypothetical protein
VATVFAMAAFLVQLAMPSALAVSAPSNVASFFPVHDAVPDTTFFHDNVGGSATDNTQMAVLSDKGGPAHLTAVSSPADTTIITATLMNWYYCDVGGALPGASGSTCTLIGTDTTATSAFQTAGYSGGTIDDAWSITWAIPASLDNSTRDIVAEGCNGTADSTHSNCKDDRVSSVLLENSSVGATPATSAGMITSPANGSAVPQEVTAKFTASTTPELTAVGFGLSGPAGSGDDADPAYGASSGDVDSFGGTTDSGVYNDLVPDTTTATARTWSASVPPADLPTNNEQALTLWSTATANMNFGAGSPVAGGVVSAICAACTAGNAALALDRNYVVLEPGTPGTTSNIYLKRTSDVTADPTCKTGPSTIAAPVGSTVSLTGCAFDAFRTAVASEGVAWGLLAGGTGFFTTTPPTSTDTKGQAVATVSAPTSAAGTNTTVTLCKDHDANGVCDSAAPAFNAAITISWSTVAGAHARSVTLKLSDGLNAAGKVKAGGFAACANNVPVKVQKRVGGSWKTLKSVKTSGTGTYKAHLANKHGKYRALAPRVTKGSAVCKRAVSPTRSH